jgi:hypothetical protein
MPEFVEEVKVKASNTQRIEYIAYYLLGALELILVFRFALKLMAASTSNGFVRAIYSVASIFMLPFEGIFRRTVVEGSQTAVVFEPTTIIAMIVYALITWGIVKLIRIFSGEKQVE